MTAAQPQPQPPSELSRLRSKVHSDLPRLEAAATFAVALSWWGYFVWRWFDLSEEFFPVIRPYLAPSSLPWLTRRPRDPACLAWDFSRRYLAQAAAWFAAHLVADRTVRTVVPQFTPHFHVLEFSAFVLSRAFLLHGSSSSSSSADAASAATVALLYLLLPPAACYLAARCAVRAGGAWAVAPAWAAGVAVMAADRAAAALTAAAGNGGGGGGVEDMLFGEFDYDTRIVFHQILVWGVMRCVSFCTVLGQRRAWGGMGSDGVTMAKCMGFYCYLPSSYMGPLATFEVYMEGIERPPMVLTRRVVRESLWSLCRCTAVLWGHCLLVHRVYVTLISSSSPALLRGLDLKSLAAVGIFRVMEFSSMYAATYGISQLMARLDGFESVPTPTCLAHVYHYSECWRLFDVGFYNYVKRYIYLPIRSLVSTSAPSFPFLSQFLAMALVYAFVFAYHGATPALARWTALNFAQVLAEATAAGCAGSLRARWSPCGGAWRRRLHAAAAVPSWFFGALTLQYFFSGSVEIGDFFTERVLVVASWTDLAATWAVGYTGVQLAVEVNNWLARRRIRRLVGEHEEKKER